MSQTAGGPFRRGARADGDVRAEAHEITAHNGAAGHWTDVLDGLRDIDWKKTNPDWQGICMAGNEVVTRVPTRRATANYIKWKLGLETERPEPVITN